MRALYCLSHEVRLPCPTSICWIPRPCECRQCIVQLASFARHHIEYYYTTLLMVSTMKRSPNGVPAKGELGEVEQGRATSGETGQDRNAQEDKPPISADDIQMVQNLIERCLQLYLTKDEVITVLREQATIDPEFTQLIWNKLEEQNPDFFKCYYTRLKLKAQIVMFNHLLEQQIQVVQKMQRGWLGNQGSATASGIPLFQSGHTPGQDIHYEFESPCDGNSRAYSMMGSQPVVTPDPAMHFHSTGATGPSPLGHLATTGNDIDDIGMYERRSNSIKRNWSLSDLGYESGHGD